MNNKFLLSIIIPVYLNEKSLAPLYREMSTVLKKESINYELIFIDDGSTDKSLSVLRELKRKNKKIKIIKLTRNFGSFNAILAGMNLAKGDCIINLAADLQDNPKLIPIMLKQWKKSFKIVIAVREKRKDSFLTKLFSSYYYKLIRKFALPNMPLGGFDIFLIDKKVAQVLKSLNEKNSSLPCQIIWTGFEIKKIFYTRRQRLHGKSQWNMSKKIKYFIDSFISFSFFPIRLMITTGFIMAFGSFIYGIVIIVNRLLNNIPIIGWSSLIVVVLFTSSLQMVTLGIIGEYLWRTFEQNKNRPNYIIEEIIK